MASPSPYGDYQAHDPGDRRYPQPDTRPSPGIAAGRLWATGAATAVVAALAAVVATLFIRAVLDVAVFAPHRAGVWGDATTGYLAAMAVAAAFVATGLLHLLLTTTAQPRLFFTWIAGLVTVVMMLLPFTTDLGTAAKIASAAVFLTIGATITGLLSATSGSVMPAREGRW
ncbi:DUF6069 family protein [Streptomyces sp. NPDC029674]|uniref:DUF6069 family protein n=1 Tax=Streptomyces sp. NPDC029674 TaxID=3365297 RepID=UPI00384A499F